MVLKGSLTFVLLVFVALAAAFLAETGVLIYEYWGHELAGAPMWYILALFDSQNFVFFPLAGVVALFAFWRPTKVVVDAFGRGRVRFGRIILPLALLVCGAGAWGLAQLLGGGDNRSFYEVAPALLAADQGESGQRARGTMRGYDEVPLWSVPPRASISDALADTRQRSSRAGLSEFIDSCESTHQLFELDEEDAKYCFASGQYLTVRECCLVKERFRAAINALHAEQPSMLHDVHRIVMPMKIFFLLILVAVGVALVTRRKSISEHYDEEVDRFAFVLLLGAALMLLWPLLNAAYTLSFDVLMGSGEQTAYRSLAPLYTLAFMVWGLMLVFYQLRSYPTQFEAIAKMGSLVGAAVGVLNYDLIIDGLNRTLGIGADVVSLSVWAVVAVLLIAVFASRIGERLVGDFDDPPSDGDAPGATT